MRAEGNGSNGSEACAVSKEPSQNSHSWTLSTKRIHVIAFVFIIVAMAIGFLSFTATSKSALKHIPRRYSRCKQCSSFANCSTSEIASSPSVIRTMSILRNGEYKDDVHRLNYTFGCLWVNACTSNDDTLLAVIVVFSAPGNTKQRDAIRRTWGRDAAAMPAKLVFFLGLTLDDELQRALQAESQSHGDIVMVNFIDGYEKLSIKSVAMLKWAADACPQAQYLIKSDDDMYVSLPNLSPVLRMYAYNRRIMIGNRRDNARVILDPNNKWYDPLYLKHYGSAYPMYLSGTTYVISLSIVRELFEASQLLPYELMEDVFVTGLCAEKVGKVTRLNHDGFSLYKRHECEFTHSTVLTGHYMSPEDVLLTWNKLHSKQCP